MEKAKPPEMAERCSTEPPDMAKALGDNNFDALGSDQFTADNSIFGTSPDRWRDLFPIPPIPESRALRNGDHSQLGVSEAPSTQRSLPSRRHAGQRLFNLKCANRVIEATNAIYAPSMHACKDPSLEQCKAQNSILSAIVRNKVDKPCMSKLDAVHELLQDSHSYTGNEVAPSTVRNYDRASVSLPCIGASSPQVMDHIDPTGREIIMDSSRTMLADKNVVADRLDTEHVEPYMDEKLRNNKNVYIQFVVDLFERNMLKFRASGASIITPFFVIKKDGRLRLVLDCRATNR